MAIAAVSSGMLMAFEKPVFCRLFSPSFTVVHSSLHDFISASKSGVEPADFSEGLFRVAVSSSRAEPVSGTVESQAVKALFPFDEIVFSANALIPEKTSVSLEAQVRIIREKTTGRNGEKADKVESGEWSGWYRLGEFRSAGGSASFAGQEDDLARVEIDTLKLKKRADAFRYRVVLGATGSYSPVLRLVSAAYTDSGAGYDEKAAAAVLKPRSAKPEAWGRTLEVPEYSQMAEQPKYARDICSPVALSMALGYWGVTVAPIEAASGVYDSSEQIYGNWFFNTAYAGLKGFDSFPARMNSVSEAEAEIAAGRPVIASITYGPGELENSPIKRTKGHLVVIRGFDKKGNFVVNDPAAPDRKSVERVYRRDEFSRAWLKNKYGTAYKIYPRFPREMAAAVPFTALEKAPASPADNGEKGVSRETDILMGEKLRISEAKDGWARAEALEQPYLGDDSPAGGYPGWVDLDDVSSYEDYGFDCAVRSKSAEVLLETTEGEVPLQLSIGTRLRTISPAENGKVRVVLPGGRSALADEGDLQYSGNIPGKKKLRKSVLDTARQFAWDKYRWGGRSGWGADCSGLVSLSLRVFGIDVPRNAQDQFAVSRRVSKKRMEEADLIFISDGNDGGKITHVMFYSGDGNLIEASGDAGIVREIPCAEKFGKPWEKLKDGETINGKKIYFRKILAD